MNAASIAQTFKAKGQPMTLTRTIAGTYDPVTGTATGATTATYTVQGITKSFAAGLTNRPDSLILSGDKQAIVDAVSVVPLPGDTLTIKGVVWQVIAVDAVEPDGTAYIYKAQVRR
jgi:hypothetical protein